MSGFSFYGIKRKRAMLEGWIGVCQGGKKYEQKFTSITSGAFYNNVRPKLLVDSYCQNFAIIVLA